jgi:hypothetical protein
MLITFSFHFLPNEMTFSNALHMRGKRQDEYRQFFPLILKRNTPFERITGGFFLALAYFGTDQSQVGRYLSGRSVRESQMGLIMNGF